jgi:hypothetical protein
VLQLSFWVLVAHSTPPWAAALMTERVLEVMPPPHFSVQVEEPDQPEILQSMGQAWTLQVRVWRSEVHAAPPWVSLVTTDLERNMVPVPQVLEQVLKEDQLESLQSMGHPNLLQALVLL